MMNLQEKIRRILKGVAKKLSNKLHCDRHGSCVHFAELFVEEINNTHPELLKSVIGHIKYTITLDHLLSIIR